MDKYKYLALDLDGTTIYHQTKITKNNIVAIQKAAKEVKIIIVTGRNLQRALLILDRYNILPFITYLVALNGAVIYSPEMKKIVFEKHFTPIECDWIFNLANHYQIQIALYPRVQNIKDRTMYIGNYRHLFLKWLLRINKNKKPIVYQTKKEIQGWKFEVFGSQYQIEQFFQQLAYEHNYNVHLLALAYRKVTEFTKENISKKSALQFLKINPLQLIAVGNGDNDIGMLRFANKGIAVANANLKVRQAVEELTAKCNRSGVAKVIQKYIL